MNYKIEDIEGIGPSYAQKLSACDIKDTDNLLDLCCSAKGRKDVASKSGVSESLLLNWSNKADLMRINGVGPQFSELLEASGVDTIKELRTRRADNLATKMAEVNQTKKLSRSVPTTEMVQGWIDEASKMEPKISH